MVTPHPDVRRLAPGWETWIGRLVVAVVGLGPLRVVVNDVKGFWQADVTDQLVSVQDDATIRAAEVLGWHVDRCPGQKGSPSSSPAKLVVRVVVVLAFKPSLLHRRLGRPLSWLLRKADRQVRTCLPLHLDPGWQRAGPVLG